MQVYQRTLPHVSRAKVNRDKLWISFHILLLKNLLWPSLEPSHHDPSNEGLQCFHWEIRNSISQFLNPPPVCSFVSDTANITITWLQHMIPLSDIGFSLFLVFVSFFYSLTVSFILFFPLPFFVVHGQKRCSSDKVLTNLLGMHKHGNMNFKLHANWHAFLSHIVSKQFFNISHCLW